MHCPACLPARLGLAVLLAIARQQQLQQQGFPLSRYAFMVMQTVVVLSLSTEDAHT